jgi:carbon monoxide dehydrogenase subunit G
VERQLLDGDPAIACDPSLGSRLLAAALIVATLALAGIEPAHAAQALASPAATTLQVERRGNEFVVQAQAEIGADLATAWRTLSDYDHLNEFIPGMSASHTLTRNGDEAVVEQQGSAGFGPFRREFTVRLAVREVSHESISAHGIGGDFKRFDSRYELQPLDPMRTRIVYRAILIPEIPVTPLVGLPVMRSMIQEQFDGLVNEVRRRSHQG